jgi:sugar transferase EpsL
MNVRKSIATVVKRAMDVTMAGCCLIVLSPLIAATALVIVTTMGSPMFFRQRRPGKGAKPFTILKFRTMTDRRDALGNLLPDQARLTRTGRWIRRWSIDELPQLFNVLSGDLSLVGPRPLLMHYLPLYDSEQARRHDVKPGITGWAQVNGRNAISWDEKFKLDVWYVDHWSITLDFKILWMSLLLVLKGEGISAGGSATMPEFLGHNLENR